MRVISEHSNANLKVWLTHEPCMYGEVQTQREEWIVQERLLTLFAVQECQLRELLQGRWPEVQTVGMVSISHTDSEKPLISSGGHSSPDDPMVMWG